MARIDSGDVVAAIGLAWELARVLGDGVPSLSLERDGEGSYFGCDEQRQRGWVIGYVVVENRHWAAQLSVGLCG